MDHESILQTMHEISLMPEFRNLTCTEQCIALTCLLAGVKFSSRGGDVDETEARVLATLVSESDRLSLGDGYAWLLNRWDDASESTIGSKLDS